MENPLQKSGSFPPKKKADVMSTLATLLVDAEMLVRWDVSPVLLGKICGDFTRRNSLWLCQNSYWKWPFIVSFPIKNGDFP